jgi:hypothetical protein
MIHHLTLGYLDLDATLLYRRPVVQKPLDMDVVVRVLRECGASEEGETFRLGFAPVQFHEGYIVCAWWLPGTVGELTKQFVQRLQEETGCAAVDVACRQPVELGRKKD